MDFVDAQKILELPEKWNKDILKKNYHRLARFYHPDKSGNTDTTKFVKLNEAYHKLLNKNETTNCKNVNLFNLFKNFNFKEKSKLKLVNKIIKITPREYLEGTNFKTIVPDYVNQNICLNCAGGGYCMKNYNLELCMNCLGDGMICGTKIISIKIHNFMDLNVPIIIHGVGKFTVLIDSDIYFYNKRLMVNFDISLKESLTGFNKIFKDPFDKPHDIIVNDIIKPNDGFLLKDLNLILKFNIIYPKFTVLKTKLININF